MSHRRLSCWFQ